MAATVCPLASGSLGNALLVASDRARVLVDAGVSQRRLKASLKAVGLESRDLSAVFLTHTHHDHFSTAAVGFCLGHNLPVYSTAENLAYLAATMPTFHKLVTGGLARPIDGKPVQIDDITVEAFAVPHDSAGECLGFRLTLGPPRERRTVTVATDLGHLPPDSLAYFVNASVVVLESNHDPELLQSSGRPPDLIERIAGPRGHLANAAAAEALAEIAGRSHAGRLRHVVLAHLSRDCNTPELALEAQAHLARRHEHPIRLAAATQHDVGPRIDM
jgi:phosphoribosyl 1,2-cyclic phosphodiesterase